MLQPFEDAAWLAPLAADRRNWLRALCSRAAALGMRVALVGGFVRDRLLGLTTDDFDLVIEGDATTLSRDLEATLGGQLRVHRPFGTATWQAPDRHTFDLASARRETYSAPAALPTVSVGATLEQDLARRDFTINALALPLTAEGVGELLDPYAGARDLSAGVLRVLHAKSFEDDPTRLFRAARYAARYRFALEPASLALVPTGITHLDDLTGDRIRHELALIAAEPTAADALLDLARSGVLRAIHPALAWTSAESAAWADLAPLRAWAIETAGEEMLEEDLALAGLLVLALRASTDADGGAGNGWGRALARLNPNATVARAVMEALSLSIAQGPSDRPSDVVAQLDALSPLAVLALILASPIWREAAARYWQTWRHVRPRTTGADLIARGLRPGPRFREILWNLRADLLDGYVDPALEAEWVERALNEGRS